jgi:phosphohistidine phosphatase
MSKCLLILRHAKSSWKEPDLSDIDRPLSKRGRRDAPRAGAALVAADLVPDQVLCSTARRARETAQAVSAEWNGEHNVAFLPELYHGGPEAYIAALRNLPDEVGRVLVIGHNPDLELLLAHLSGQNEALPTAAWAEVILDLDHWTDVAPDTVARLGRLWQPRTDP